MQDQSQIPQNIRSDESSFLSYWQEIDIIKQFDATALEGSLDQPVRSIIINVLSEGRTITDENDNERVLRVMNASQILERINEIAKSGEYKHKIDEIKRSNLYYHLNALEEKGFIREVGLIPKKNRLISYYGRTARVFLLNYEQDKVPSFLDEDALPILMKQINPDINDETVQKAIEGLKLIYKDVNTEPINNWIKKNERQLRESEIDIRKLHNTFYKILAFDDKTISAMREFAKAMKLEI